MKRMFIILIVVLLILSGCSASDSGNTSSLETSSGAAASAEKESAETEEPETNEDIASAENREPTLDDAQVRFVYADDDYLLLAYYGPQEDISTTFCNADGTDFSKAPTP